MTHPQLALIDNTLALRAKPTFGDEVALRRLRAKIVRKLTDDDLDMVLHLIQETVQ